MCVGSEIASLVLNSTAACSGPGSVNAPLVGAMLLSQLGSGIAFRSGISVESMSVTIVPAPGGLAGGRRRQ